MRMLPKSHKPKKPSPLRKATGADEILVIPSTKEKPSRRKYIPTHIGKELENEKTHEIENDMPPTWFPTYQVGCRSPFYSSPVQAGRRARNWYDLAQEEEGFTEKRWGRRYSDREKWVKLVKFVIPVIGCLFVVAVGVLGCVLYCVKGVGWFMERVVWFVGNSGGL